MLGLIFPEDGDSGTSSSPSVTLHPKQDPDATGATSSSEGADTANGTYNVSEEKPVNYVLLCPPDVIEQAMLKYPPGHLQV
jgi:hypothetical protein